MVVFRVVVDANVKVVSTDDGDGGGGGGIEEGTSVVDGGAWVELGGGA